MNPKARRKSASNGDLEKSAPEAAQPVANGTIEPVPKAKKRGWKLFWQILAQLFLLFHVVAITSWSLPSGAPAIENGSLSGNLSEDLLAYNDIYVRRSPVALYVLSTGLWQSWDMFSPNPASSDIYADALVYYKSGEVYEYNYPRMYSLPLITKYEQERYRKFFEHANTDEYLYLPFAKRVAQLCDKGPSNPVVKVVLRRHWYDIPAPENFAQYSDNLWSAILKGKLSGSDVIAPTPPHPEVYNTYAYYTYVPPGGGT